MQCTLYEIDIENDRRRAVLESRRKVQQKELLEGRRKGGIDEERLALVRNLINSGQSEQQVEDFLVNIRKMTPAKTKAYYQKVFAGLGNK